MIKEQVAKMKRFRTTGLALLAVFALSAVVASVAQAETAPFFTVGGTRLVAGKTHNFDARIASGSSFVLTVVGTGVSVTCTSFSVEKGVLLGSNAGQPGKDDEIATFSSCTVAGNGATCTVNEPIKTNQLTSELVENESNRNQLLEEFKPTAGAAFVSLTFAGTCTVVSGTVSAEGSAAAEVLLDNAGQGKIELGQKPEEATSWLVKFPTTPITSVLLVNTKGERETTGVGLTLGGLESTLGGTVLTLLANTKFEPEPTAKWSPLP